MTMIKAVEPDNWSEVLGEVSERNKGRRARFEVFSFGDFAEEEQEGYFESASIDGNKVTITRTYEHRGEQKTMTDVLENIRGVSIQLDIDKSDSMLEFTNDKNELTTLRFESNVDGAS
jgi:hypothetical protein